MLFTLFLAQIKVGGHVINPVAFRKNIAYVMQDDALMPTATPREALRFSASLRLPSTMTSEDIEKRVTTLLDYLGLVDCADVIIGGALIKGISGGQRKRTSVGVEIITDPTVSGKLFSLSSLSHEVLLVIVSR
jgi:ABC-type multidrug transport system ATPase subunit